MSLQKLTGRYLSIRDSDGKGMPAKSTVRAVSSSPQMALLEFSLPLVLSSNTYPFAIAQPRLQRDDLSMLLDDVEVGCSITYVPQDQYCAAMPFDLSWWRGGGGSITDVYMD